MSVFRYLPMDLIVLLACGALVVAAIVVLATPPNRRGEAVQVLLRVALVGCVIALLAITVIAGGSSGGVNLVPFAGIRSELGNVNRELAFANVVGNVLMFVPVPILARLTWVPTWPRAFGCGVVLSVAIELIQLGTGRSADIDDVLLNSAGSLVGAVGGFLVAAVVARVRASRRAAAARLGAPLPD